MGYFSSNIPKDHGEAQRVAKRAFKVLKRGIKTPKGIVETPETKGTKFKSMNKHNKKEEMAGKMKSDAWRAGFKKDDPAHLRKDTGSHFEKLKKNQKGRQSLNKPKGEHNEGERNYLSNNEINRP